MVVMEGEAAWDMPVSYTHLDVYKRQLYGCGGILELAGLMQEAAMEEKDTGKLIQVKGWGCFC